MAMVPSGDERVDAMVVGGVTKFAVMDLHHTYMCQM